MDQLLIDSIKADLDLCLTLVDVAETDYKMGNREHVERTCMNAEKGYLDMLRFFCQVTRMTPEVSQELQSKFKQLRERLDGLRQATLATPERVTSQWLNPKNLLPA
jgi:hypothetical protein